MCLRTVFVHKVVLNELDGQGRLSDSTATNNNKLVLGHVSCNEIERMLNLRNDKDERRTRTTKTNTRIRLFVCLVVGFAFAFAKVRLLTAPGDSAGSHLS